MKIVSFCFFSTRFGKLEIEIKHTSLPECVEDDSTNSNSSSNSSNRLSGLGLNRFTRTMRTESNVVGCIK